MNLRKLTSCAPISLALPFVVVLFSASAASAQESPPPSDAGSPPASHEDAKPDNVRFRGGIALEGGGIIVPNFFNVAVVGFQGQVGVQINNLVGVYVAPSFDAVFGKYGGINVATALLVDFTPIPMITIGVGPDVGAFVGLGVDTSATGASLGTIGGGLMGGRLHFGFNPVIGGSDANPSRRKALVIGLDARLLAGGAGYVAVGGSTSGGSVSGGARSGFVFAPQLTIGYQAF